MKQEKPTAAETGGRWLRVGVLTLTVVGPMVRTLIEFMRQPKQSPEEQAEEIQNNISISEAMALSQMDDLTLARRQRTAEQARELRRQAKELRSQAKQLRQVQRTEDKQRRQLHALIQQLQAAGIDWNQELQQRIALLAQNAADQSSSVASDLIERGQDVAKRTGKATSKLLERGRQASQQAVQQSSDTVSDLSSRGSDLTQNLLKRGTELSHDIAERSSQLTQDIQKRSSKLTHDLQKRSSKTARKLSEQSQKLLEPGSQRSTFWTVLGFSFGLVLATVITYLLVRRRMRQQQEDEQNQHIELPQRQDILATPGTSRPLGEIHHTDADGTAVATLPAVDVAGGKVETPADATFVGVISTKQYYPITAMPEAVDLVYFTSEEEAKNQGFSSTQ